MTITVVIRICKLFFVLFSLFVDFLASLFFAFVNFGGVFGGVLFYKKKSAKQTKFLLLIKTFLFLGLILARDRR